MFLIESMQAITIELITCLLFEVMSLKRSLGEGISDTQDLSIRRKFTKFSDRESIV